MKPSKLRIGVVGAGAIVRQRHLPALAKLPGVEIVAISNASYESAERFCHEFARQAVPIEHWAGLIALDHVDIVWIGAPPYLHAGVTISALEAGKHVFCQARMAMNLAEALEMREAARRHPQLVTMLCPAPHGMRGDLVIRKLLAEEAIGPVHEVRLRSLGGQFLDRDAPAHWRQRVELSGLNVLTFGIYVEVLQRWLGPIRAVQARARTVFADRGGYTVRIPDLIHVLCAFENGAEGVLSFSGVAAAAPSDRLELHGRDGTLLYDFSNDAIGLVYTGAATTPQPVDIRVPPALAVAWRAEEDFLAAVRSPGQMQPRPSFDDGVRYMRVVEAAAEAVATGAEVRIEKDEG